MGQRENFNSQAKKIGQITLQQLREIKLFLNEILTY